MMTIECLDVPGCAINGMGQRVQKTVQSMRGTQTTRFIYDEAGRLMGEYRLHDNGFLETWSRWREYIWLDDRLVGVVDEAGAVLEVYTDHLGTPRAVLDSSGQKRWEWRFEQNAFGTRAPNENPAGNQKPFEFNLRFPGQYYDAETGLHYNYFRDYEPGVGRYVQSDPIGLRGGLSTYSYALNSPLRFWDELGLWPLEDSDEPLGNLCFESFSCFCRYIGGCSGFNAGTEIISCMGRCIRDYISDELRDAWQGHALKKMGMLANHLGKRALWIWSAVDFARCKAECDREQCK